jgi:hypothetical protein
LAWRSSSRRFSTIASPPADSRLRDSGAEHLSLGRFAHDQHLYQVVEGVPLEPLVRLAHVAFAELC